MKIGLLIVGDEILSGRRQDKHLQAVIDLLTERQLLLSWVQILGDDFQQLVNTFEQTLQSQSVVFSTGGIGGTPDDLTRQALAAAAGVELLPHPQGMQILRDKFKDELTPLRQRMVEFPQGAELIPNPVNQIPGFSFKRHHCVPGFPKMAQPMMRWVLDEYYRQAANILLLELAVKVINTPESRLIPIMEQLLQSYPELKVFSLPNIDAEPHFVELGVKAVPTIAKAAMQDIKETLDKENIPWERVV